MPENDSSRKLGISFGGERICIADMHCSSGNYRVLNLKELDIKSPFYAGSPLNSDIISNLADEIKPALEEMDIDTKDTGFSICRRYAVLKRIPVDNDLNKKELEEHNSWEISQYITSPLSEYSCDCQILKSSSDDYQQYLLSVGIRKDVILYLSELADLLSLNIKLIDIDVFSIYNAYHLNYNDDKKVKRSLVTAGADQFTVIILKGGDFLGFQTVYGQREGRDFSDVSVTIKEMNKSLKLLSSDLEVDRDDFDQVVICRNTPKVNLDRIIEENSTVQLEKADPFKKVSLGRKVSEQVDLYADNTHFLEAIGLTIRKF